MVRQAFDLLGHPVRGERLQGLDNAGVQHPPPLLQQTAVGHLVRQGVLEGVFVLGEQARLVEELGRLEVRQAAMQRRPRAARQWPAAAARAPPCQSPRRSGGGVSPPGQAVDARRQHRLHRGWHLKAGERLRQAIGPRLAHQHPGLHQGAHALFQKEGIALGARNQELLERRQAGVVPEQGLQEFVGAGRRQRVEPQLGVVGLAAPAVLILGR